MLAHGLAGQLPSARAVSGFSTAPSGTFGEINWSELLPPYYGLIKAGVVWGVGNQGTGLQGGFSATTNAGFVAGGAVNIGLYNPLGSGVDIVPLWASWTILTTAPLGGGFLIGYAICNQGRNAPVTGTQTPSTNLYSLKTGGSRVRALVNTTATGSKAGPLVRVGPDITGQSGSGQVNICQPFIDDFRGSIVIPPNNFFAMTADSLGGQVDTAMSWAEIPV